MEHVSFEFLFMKYAYFIHLLKRRIFQVHGRSSALRFKVYYFIFFCLQAPQEMTAYLCGVAYKNISSLSAGTGKI